jgi:hypothetical protein
MGIQFQCKTPMIDGPVMSFRGRSPIHRFDLIRLRPSSTLVNGKSTIK